MEAAGLDNEIERIRKKLPFLWRDYGFKVKYFTCSCRRYDKGFIIGLENDKCKLVFEKETNSIYQPIAISVGKNSSSFTPPNYSYYAKYDWYPLTGLIYWLTRIECKRDKVVDQDLDYVSEYLKSHIDNLFDLFKYPDEFDGRIEYYRNLYQDRQLTIEKIRTERARLQALGQDSSLEAAIANLRGGMK